MMFDKMEALLSAVSGRGTNAVAQGHCVAVWGISSTESAIGNRGIGQ